MASKLLSDEAVSAFCENMAMLFAAGVAPAEAADLLCGDTAENALHDAACALRDRLAVGGVLSAALADGGFFPEYLPRMVAAGEKAGRTEQVLRSLADYYHSRDQMQRRLKSAVLYPTLLLMMMALILAALLAMVLPVFAQVYASLAGDLAASSYGYLRLANGIGWAALVATAALAACLAAGWAAARSPRGLAGAARVFERLPVTAGASAQLALSRFTNVLSIFIASGLDMDTAIGAAEELAGNRVVLARIAACRREMQEQGVGLARAIYDQKLFEPLYGRMLLSGAQAGDLDGVLARLGAIFAEDAEDRITGLADGIEPLFSGFLTLAVGATLLSAMLPLIGILGSIG